MLYRIMVIEKKIILNYRINFVYFQIFFGKKVSIVIVEFEKLRINV